MSEWSGNFRAARWYGEVVFARGYGELLGEDQDSNWGYSHSIEKPDYDTLNELIPDGYVPYEKVILKVPEGD